MSKSAGILVLCMGLAAVGCQNSGTASSGNVGVSTNGKMNGAGTATENDRHFFMDAAAGGAYEVQASQIELQKGTSADAKNIAQRMVTDHTKANTQLAALAQSRGVQVTAAPNSMQQGKIDKLNGLSGSALDQEYLRQQQTAHQDTISLFQTATQNTSQPVAAWASKTLPTLQSHLAMINQALGQNGNGMNGM